MTMTTIKSSLAGGGTNAGGKRRTSELFPGRRQRLGLLPVLPPLVVVLLLLWLPTLFFVASPGVVVLVSARPHHHDRDDDSDDSFSSIGLVRVASRYSFNETHSRLMTALNANAVVKVVAEINHHRNAESVGLALPPSVSHLQSVVFGNPKVGTPLMRHNRMIGLDLPLTVLLWQDAAAVYMAYSSVVYLRAKHPGLGRVDALATMAGALVNMTRAATGNDDHDDADDAEDMDNLGRREFDKIRHDLDRGLFRRRSNADFNTTWTRLITALEQAAPAGVMIAYQVDHAANAPPPPQDLAPTRVVAFANPSLGTKLMQVNPAAGIDLPLKILVSQHRYYDDDGHGGDNNKIVVLVSTNRISFLRYRHGLVDDATTSSTGTGIDKTIATMRSAVTRFVTIAATGQTG